MRSEQISFLRRERERDGRERRRHGMCRRRHGKRLVDPVALPSIPSQSFTTNTVTSLFASLSVCFESVFFLFLGRAAGREQRREYMVVCRTGINYIHECVYIHVLTCSCNHSFRFCWYVLFLCSLEL